MPSKGEYWARPRGGSETGVLVLAGSSGRVDGARAELLASHGVSALALRWFGGDGLPERARHVPLEYFSAALDRLAAECDRVALLGLSYGAEAALLTGVVDPRPQAVIALAPTDVVWEGDRRTDDDPPASKWTLGGTQLPFVPLDRSWRPDEAGLPAFADLYRRSRATAAPEVVAAATIAVERINADVLLITGGDDQVWPSADAAQRIAGRRAQHHQPTTVIIDEHAGHQVTLPDEAAAASSRPYRVGGDPEAPARLGRAAWPLIAELLHIDRPTDPQAPGADCG